MARKTFSILIMIIISLTGFSCAKSQLSLEKQCEISYQTSTNYFRKGQHDQALLEVNKAVTDCPTIWKYWYLKASIEFGLENYLSAEESCRQAIRLKNNCPDCYDFLGQIATTRGQYEKAYSYFQKALNNKDYRRPVVTIYNLGILFEKQGKYSEALNQFTKAGKIDPSFDMAFLHKGDMLMMLNRADEAVFAYRQAYIINRKLCDAYIGLIKAYNRTGKYKKARDTARRGCQNLGSKSQCCKNLKILLR